jgi:hypothetical protein
MAKSTFSNRQTLAAGLGTSLLVSSLTMGLGLCVLDDINTRGQHFKNEYLQRRQIALVAGEELTRATRSSVATADSSSLARAGSSSAEGSQSGNGQGRSASMDPQDISARIAPLARALHAYEAGGPLRGDEATQVFFVKRSLAAYRKALAARLETQAGDDLQNGTDVGDGAAQDSNVAAAQDSKVAAAQNALVRGFGRLAALAGDRASELDTMLTETIANLSRLFLLIGALAILAGIPPALWIMRVCEGESAGAGRLRAHPGNAAVC